MRNPLDFYAVRPKDFHPTIGITWQKSKKDYFVVFSKQTKQIYARIYKENDNWFIYYENPGYRIQVNSFSDATAMIEEEVMRCEAAELTG